jgi:hypothetical protein
MKDVIKRLVPRRFRSAVREMRQSLWSKTNQTTTTEEIFTHIYRSNSWGGAPGEFNSGPGTTDPLLADPYCDCIAKLGREFGFSRLRAVELGCGDMRIGSRIRPLFASYHGVDIVKDLIEHHRQAMREVTGLTFSHLNIVEDPLPEGEVCMIRQVLQHLSNVQIEAVLAKLAQYRYVIITEHLPAPNPQIVPNLDQDHGAEVRVQRNSGVYLSAPPFNLPKSAITTALEIPGYGGIVKTMVYRPPGNWSGGTGAKNS